MQRQYKAVSQQSGNDLTGWLDSEEAVSQQMGDQCYVLVNRVFNDILLYSLDYNSDHAFYGIGLKLPKRLAYSKVTEDELREMVRAACKRIEDSMVRMVLNDREWWESSR